MNICGGELPRKKRRKKKEEDEGAATGGRKHTPGSIAVSFFHITPQQKVSHKEERDDRQSVGTVA